MWVVPGTRSRTSVSLARPDDRAWEVARGGPNWTAGKALALGRVQPFDPNPKAPGFGGFTTVAAGGSQ